MTGVRVCLKELYGTKYDPLSISYTVLSGRDKKGLVGFVFFVYQRCISFRFTLFLTSKALHEK